MTPHVDLTVKEHCYRGESRHYPGEAEGMKESSAYTGAAKENWYKKYQKDLTMDCTCGTKSYLKQLKTERIMTR